jgi:hypothetical protein
MTIVRSLVPGLSALLAAWVVLSFAGVMFNPGNAGFWTTSLISSLLASVLIMPVLVIVHHATKRADTRKATERAPSFTRETPNVGRETSPSPAPASPPRKGMPER